MNTEARRNKYIEKVKTIEPDFYSVNSVLSKNKALCLCVSVFHSIFRKPILFYYNIKGKRYKESLGITLEAPVSKEIRQANCAKLQLAKLLRAQREIDYLHAHYWSQLPPLFHSPSEKAALTGEPSPDFFLVAIGFLNLYHQKDYRVVQAAFSYLRRFHPSTLPVNHITRGFCTRFFCFLQEKLRGNTPVNYFKKFKMCLDYCVEEGLLSDNPGKGIRLPQYNDVTKEILSSKELVKLTLTPCRNPEVKRAFFILLPERFALVRYSRVML